MVKFVYEYMRGKYLHTIKKFKTIGFGRFGTQRYRSDAQTVTETLQKERIAIVIINKYKLQNK